MIEIGEELLISKFMTLIANPFELFGDWKL